MTWSKPVISSAVLLSAWLAAAAPVPTPQSLPVLAVCAPKATLHLQVAQTEPQRERGLMGVTHLAQHSGMLFVFQGDDRVTFWMKDTLIPLDMVFLSPNGRVRTIFANVPVLAHDTADSQIPLEQAQGKYVIELPANEAAKDGLRAGARVFGIPGARTP